MITNHYRPHWLWVSPLDTFTSVLSVASPPPASHRYVNSTQRSCQTKTLPPGSVPFLPLVPSWAVFWRLPLITSTAVDGHCCWPPPSGYLPGLPLPYPSHGLSCFRDEFYLDSVQEWLYHRPPFMSLSAVIQIFAVYWAPSRPSQCPWAYSSST